VDPKNKMKMNNVIRGVLLIVGVILSGVELFFPIPGLEIIITSIMSYLLGEHFTIIKKIDPLIDEVSEVKQISKKIRGEQ